MHLPTFSADLSRRAATLAATGFVVVAGFQLLLAMGVPWGRATLGGYIDGTLPPELRVVSSVSMAVFIAATIVVLGRAGHGSDRFSRAFSVGTWIGGREGVARQVANQGRATQSGTLPLGHSPVGRPD